MSQPTTYSAVDGSSVQHQNFGNRQGIVKPNQLVWLDSKSKETSLPIKTLQKLTDDTKLFHCVDTCEEYIRSSSEIHTFLITSEVTSPALLPHVHDLNHVLAIYIHVNSTGVNILNLSSDYSKVSAELDY